MRLPAFSRLVLAVILLSVPATCLAGFDLSKLDSRIDLTLDDSSMADTVSAIAQASGLDIAAPSEPKNGLTASWTQESLREILNTLSKISGLSWHIENTVIVFKKPITPADLPPPATKKFITPGEGVISLLASLSDVQLFLITRGVLLPYADLTPAQQEIISAILMPPNSSMTDSGSAMTSLPKPDQTALAFRVMPLLTVPKTTGGDGMTLRLDSMPYVTLVGKEAR